VEKCEAALSAMIADDPWMMRVLRTAATLDLPDWWIGAGFVRARVWDRLAELAAPTVLEDVDVIYHQAGDLSEGFEKEAERRLAEIDPAVPWSVKNQARMHLKNGDAPYRDLSDAIAHWLETATCLAARLDRAERLTIIAPWGLEDLMALRLRPTPSGLRRPDAYQARLKQKNWQARWPLLSHTKSR